jgi:hypothetical protein
MTQSLRAAPTARQLSYLRALATKTGATFAYPVTRAQASHQIDRLRRLKREPPTPHLQPDGLDSAQLVYATAVHDSEVSGYGSSASWRVGSRPSQFPSLPKIPARKPTELARYTLSGGERVLQGKLIDGSLNVTDSPAAGGGRSYVVESDLELEGSGALEALVADYLKRARELDEVPMASAAVRQLFIAAGADV